MILTKYFSQIIFDNLKNFTMITRIGSERLECVQKEQYKKLYKEASNEGAQIKFDKKPYTNCNIMKLTVNLTQVIILIRS